MKNDENKKISIFDNSENIVLELDDESKGFCSKETGFFLGTIVLTEKN